MLILLVYQDDLLVYNVGRVVEWYVVIVVQGYMLMWCLPGQYLLPPLSTSQTLTV